MYNKRVDRIKLNHEEVLVKLNKETGEIKELKSRPNNIPSGKELVEFDFSKAYNPIIWRFLFEELTPLERDIVSRMTLMAEYGTNSLIPLDDDTTIPQLMETFNISKNKVTATFKKLFNLGIYARFEVKRVDVPYTKYWILNPYISFKGKLVDSDIKNLFRGTRIQIYYSNQLNQYN